MSLLGKMPVFNPPCKMPGCTGRVDANKLCFLPARGFVIPHARYACSECGRLHDCNGVASNNKDGNPWYYDKETGNPVLRKEEKK